MKKAIILITTLLFTGILMAQESDKIIGFWKYSNVTTTNPDCKSVNYFPIQSFNFKENGEVIFKSAEGTAKAKYKVSNSIILLTDLSENGVKQEGSGQFHIKNITETRLTLLVAYDCGSIDIVFKK